MKKIFYVLRIPYLKANSVKTLRIMKLTNLLFLITVLNVFGNTSYSQYTKLNLDLKDVPIQTVLSAIEDQSEFFFLYSSKMIDVNRKVNIYSSNGKVSEVLENLFANTNIKYDVKDRQILLVNKNAESEREMQQLVISGIVTDKQTGEVMPGVNIQVKGTTIGTSTNSEGRFNLPIIDRNSTLIFSFIGYVSKEMEVGNSNTLNVSLDIEETSLDEVVITALGISKEKKSLAYAVTEVGGENFVKARETNIGNALSGKIAGVNATSTATGPGGSSRVIIRGNGSLGGNNQPLYVVNGVPIDNSNFGSAGMWGGYDSGDGLSSINPDDIENISVLKGGTAAALYGSRAANGVILITTKSGKAQKGIGVELNSTYTLENALVTSDWQQEYGSGVYGLKPTTQAEAIQSGTISWGAKMDGSMVIQPDGVPRPYSPTGSNIKKLYQTGNTFSNTITFNAGNESANVRFSASNMNNTAIIPNSGIKRNTFNLSGSANLTKKVIFEANVQYNIEKGQNRPWVSDQPLNVNSAPQLLATNIDIRMLKNYCYDENGNELLWHIGDANNPYFIIDKVKTNDERRRLIGTFSTRYNIIKDFLFVRGKIGVDYYNVNADDLTPSGIKYWTPSYNSSKSTVYETNVEGLIGFNKTFNRISVDAMVGGNQMHNVVDRITLSSGELNVPFQYFIRNGKSPSFGQGFSEYAINSIFANVNVGYHNYLYLNLSGREDWFSTLPGESNSLLYPSVGMSFVFSEAWKSRPDWLSYGKIRSSWAQVGGGAPNPYALNLVYVAGSSSHLGQPLMDIDGGTIPNKSIKPYTSTTTEFGLDLRAFDNRIGADITVYNRITSDDIVSASVPASTSYVSVLLNVGEVRNRGIEIAFNGSPFKTRNGFNWDLLLNIAYNKNTVLKIAEGLSSLMLENGQIRTKNGFVYHYEGLPFGQVAGYKIKKDEAGNVVYDRASGLPVKSEFMALGNGVPPLNISLSNSFNYKNFSFSFLIDGKFGGKLYSATNAYGTRWGLSKRTIENNVRETGVSVSGVDTEGEPYNAVIPAQTYYQGISLTITDEFVYDASFIKLRQFSLGYSLPNSILSKTPLQAVTLSLVARNLLLLYSNIPNVDPESTYNSGNAQGLEMYGVPPTRSLGLNLMVRF